MFPDDLSDASVVRDYCFAAAFTPGDDVSPAFRVRALEELLRGGHFSCFVCRCMGPDWQRMSPEEQTMWIDSEDEIDSRAWIERVWELPSPYDTHDDRVTDVAARLLSGYQSHDVNTRAFPASASVLETLVWMRPKFATPARSIYESDPRPLLRAIIEIPAATSFAVGRRAAKLLDRFRDISSAHCACYPGNAKLASRAELAQWLRSKAPPLRSQILDDIVHKELGSLATPAARAAYPKAAALLDRVTRLAGEDKEWLPYDLYGALDPPQPDEFAELYKVLKTRTR